MPDGAASFAAAPEAGASGGARIGPNAILQLIAPMQSALGRDATERILARAGLFHLPNGSAMIPESDAARLHRQLRADEPVLAPLVLAEAGHGTALYIMGHRIPRAARALLRAMPAPLAARALSRAIARHAWTFVGSGRFRAVTPWLFEIEDNVIVAGERARRCSCDWHAAVFAGLYSTLVARDCHCVETACAARGDPLCRFEVSRGQA